MKEIAKRIIIKLLQWLADIDTTVRVPPWMDAEIRQRKRAQK